MASKIGNLEVLPVREAFAHEAHNFTTWLEKNIDTLSSRIGLPLIVEQREVPIGKFRADLVCRDNQGNSVVIENQLEQTDHDHLGKLMTYMGNLKANTAIWITPQPRLEHQIAVEHFNAQKNTGFAFYLVKLEAIRIDNSRPAPLFTVIARPLEQPEPVEETQVEQYISIANPVVLDNLEGLPTVWCVYPRRDKETYELFLNEGVIGLGFGNLGDLKKINPSPQAFKDAWKKKNPFTSEAQIRTFYPMFYSLIHRVKVGDLVVYPSTWLDRKIHIGRITGDYKYRGGNFIRSLFVDYPDVRPVEWLEHLSREAFSPEALKGIAVTLAIFQIRNETFLLELTTKLR